MLRCIELAQNGLGTTYPNPMVGSVIVYNDRIIGEGWHQKAGEAHAEVNAIQSVENHKLLPKSTIYVSLEPCSHYGKTPPCSDLIIAKGIKRVVIGIIDPFAEVAGKGIQKLISAGCEVTLGVLEKECQELNKRFFTFHKQKRPYIILKWAQTEDYFIAPVKEERTQQAPVWITGSQARQLVHKWRAEEQAILIGTQTALADNPSLTTRDWEGHSPTRLVIDRKGIIPKTHAIFNNKAETIILTAHPEEFKENIKTIKIDFDLSVPKQICDVLFDLKLQSLIVEGGAKTLQGFIDENLWDEARIFTGQHTFENGIKAPQINGNSKAKYKVEDETLELLENYNLYYPLSPTKTTIHQ